MQSWWQINIPSNAMQPLLKGVETEDSKSQPPINKKYHGHWHLWNGMSDTIPVIDPILKKDVINMDN